MRQTLSESPTSDEGPQEDFSGQDSLVELGFEPIGVLHRGSVSNVWEAKNEREGRLIALKILHPHFASDRGLRRRLYREVATLRRLEDDGIIKVFGIHESESQLALELELARGPSLREMIHRDGLFLWEEARPILETLLGALDKAHRRGIWHRDLHADHIIMTQEGPKIIGFGLSRVNELAALTMHTRILGSLESMAPERILGMDYDSRADLYSLGAVAFEMLLGFPLHDGTIGQAYAFATRQESLDLPEELPAQARYFLHRALVADPTSRFGSARQMQRALHEDEGKDHWNSLVSRSRRSCPQCSQILIRGFFECLHCGHQIRRLIQEPGKGDFSIVIIASKTVEQTEERLEGTRAPLLLNHKQFEGITNFLRSYEDTLPYATGSLEYHFPPYILFDGLTKADKDRVVEELADREIPHKAFASIENEGNLRLGAEAAPVEDSLIWIGLVVFLGVGLFLSYDSSYFWPVFPLYGLSLVLSALFLRALAKKWSKKALPQHFGTTRAGLPVMIPTTLEAGISQDSGPPLFDQARDLVQRLQSRESSLLRDFMDVLSLLQFPRNQVRFESAEVAGLYQGFEFLHLLEAELKERGTQGILREVEEVQAKLDALDSAQEGDLEDLTALQERLLEENDAREEALGLSTLLSARLIHIRASLLELSAPKVIDEEAAHQEVKEELQALALLLQTHPQFFEEGSDVE